MASGIARGCVDKTAVAGAGAAAVVAAAATAELPEMAAMLQLIR